jgi:hypothetical protein
VTAAGLRKDTMAAESKAAGEALAAAQADLARHTLSAVEGVGTVAKCSTRHPTHLDPSILQLNDII